MLRDRFTCRAWIEGCGVRDVLWSLAAFHFRPGRTLGKAYSEARTASAEIYEHHDDQNNNNNNNMMLTANLRTI